MRIRRSDLQILDSPLYFQETVAEIGIIDLGPPGTPVRLECSVHQVGNDYQLASILRVDLTLNCDRCLMPVRLPVESGFEVWLVSERRQIRGTSEEDIIEFPSQKNEVDLTQFEMDAIYLGIPQKIICMDTCKGLCQTCGTNFNEADCACGVEPIDERWEPLMDLRKQLGE